MKEFAVHAGWTLLGTVEIVLAVAIIINSATALYNRFKRHK